MTAPVTAPELGIAEVLEALADRCEAATLPLPDRVLNRDIARAIGWGYQTPSEAGRRHPAWFHPEDCRNGVPVLDSLHGTDVWREPLDYVGSLDAALTLVPAGYDWTLRHVNGGLTILAEVGGTGDDHMRFAASPALALTAAALRSAAEAARAGEGK